MTGGARRRVAGAVVGVLLAAAVAASLREPLVRPMAMGAADHVPEPACADGARLGGLEGLLRGAGLRLRPGWTGQPVLVLSQGCSACDDIVQHLARADTRVRQPFLTVQLYEGDGPLSEHPLAHTGRLLWLPDREATRRVLCARGTPALLILDEEGAVSRVLRGREACSYALTGGEPGEARGCNDCGGL